MKVMRRFPESMRVANVGHWVAGIDAEGGAYDTVSSPAPLNTVSYAVGGKSSELTIKRDRTGLVLIRK